MHLPTFGQRCCIFVYLILALLVQDRDSVLFAVEVVPWVTSQSDSVDAPLRSITAASRDNLWAAGDRGLVMQSNDAGKTWNQRQLSSNVDFRQIEFADNQTGFLVGGFIWPVTGRSDGTLLRTEDAGQRWRNPSLMPIARLMGVKAFSKDHLLVWGDYSVEHRSALLESFDGGVTFNRRETPCAHIIAAAWLNPAQGVIIDRLSRVFVTQNGRDYQQVDLPANPLSPLNDATSDGTTIWLCGDQGQLYKSASLKSWQRVNFQSSMLSDLNLSLTSVHASGGTVWTTSNWPGLIFSSQDGENFHANQTGCPVVLHRCCRISGSQTVAVGAMNNIVETRNSGEGWWSKHQAGGKLGMLVIAARAEDLPLDAMVHAALGEKQHVGALIIHSQDAISRADVWPDIEQRTQQISSVAVASHMQFLKRFPIGSLSGSSPRALDLVAYEAPGQKMSGIEREMVLAIRTWRPDVVVVAGSEAQSPIVTRCTTSALHAIQAAGDPTFQLAGSDPFFELPSWRVQRTLSRVSRRSVSSLADWKIEPTALLGESGQTVADRLRIAWGLRRSPFDLEKLVMPQGQVSAAMQSTPPSAHASLEWNRIELYGDYTNRSSTRRTTGQSTSYFAGILQSEASRRAAEDTKLRSLQVLLASTKMSSAFDALVAMDLRNEAQRKKWLSDMRAYADTLPAEERCRFMLELSLVYLHRGDWQHWKLCLESALLDPRPSVWREIGIHLAMQFAQSEEYLHAFADQQATSSPEQVKLAATPAAISPAAFVSPFEINALTAASTTSSEVLTALQPISPAVQTAEFQMGKDIDAKVQEDAPKSKLDTNTSSVPIVTGTQASKAVLAESLLKLAVPVSWSDPRWSLMKNARASLNHAPLNSQDASLRTLAQFDSVLGWAKVGRAEMSLGNRSAPPPYRISPVTEQRPTLDGRLNDQVWQSALPLELSSAWPEDITANASIRLAHDAEFIYLGVFCPLKPQSLEKSPLLTAHVSLLEEPQLLATKQRDIVSDAVDHLSIRFDFDRDYMTYYQFTLARDGSREDAVNCFDLWNPKWYIAQSETPEAWVAEVAIPLKELTVWNTGSKTIAVNARRQIPATGVQNLGGIPSDEWLPQSSVLVRLDAPTTE